MLTRAQVARRLGRSIATVRRLEGSVLHPTRDHRGVYRFDDAEVAKLARDRRLSPREGDGASARSGWFEENVFVDDDDGELDDGWGEDDEAGPEALCEPRDGSVERDMAEATAKITAALNARVQELEAELDEQSAREAERERVEAAERRAMALDLRREVEALSDRDLQRLAPETLEQIELLLATGA